MGNGNTGALNSLNIAGSNPLDNRLAGLPQNPSYTWAANGTGGVNYFMNGQFIF